MKKLWERFTSTLTPATPGRSLSAARETPSDGLPPSVPPTTPSAVPVAAPSAVPGVTPVTMPSATPPPTADAAPIQQNGSASDQKLDVYPVYEGRIIVGFSPTPAVSRRPRRDAEALLYALVDGGHAGESILASAMQEFYSECCMVAGVEPYPWQLVATELIDLTGGKKPYERVRGVKKRVYKIPTSWPPQSSTSRLPASEHRAARAVRTGTQDHRRQLQ
jgi:hypothetical protein